MRVAIYLRSPHQKIQSMIAQHVMRGCHRLNDEASIFGPDQFPDCDTMVMFGIGGNALQYYDMYRSRGKRVVFLDKGYTRSGHFRVSIDSFQPLSYFQRIRRSPDRWRQLGLVPRAYDLARLNEQEHILFDGASNKYCAFNRLGHWHDWGKVQVEKIAANTKLKIIYRPRPSQHVESGAVKSIDGTIWSQGEIKNDYERSRIVVSHGGNIGFEAVLHGIPHFAIDVSIARPVSEVNWLKVGTPFIPEHHERMQFLYDVSYLQWAANEISDGPGWRYIRDMLDLPR